MFEFLLLSWHQLKLRLLLKAFFFILFADVVICWIIGFGHLLICCVGHDWFFSQISHVCLFLSWNIYFLVLLEKVVYFIPPVCDSFKDFSTVTAYLLWIPVIYIRFKISLFLHQSGKKALLDIPFFVHGYLLQNMKIWNT